MSLSLVSQRVFLKLAEICSADSSVWTLNIPEPKTDEGNWGLLLVDGGSTRSRFLARLRFDGSAVLLPLCTLGR